MIAQNSTLLLEIINHIQSMIADQKVIYPALKDEEIIDQIKLHLKQENGL